MLKDQMKPLLVASGDDADAGAPSFVEGDSDSDDELYSPAALDASASAAAGRTPHNMPPLFCAILGSATSGVTAYGFSIYSAELMHNLSLTEGQLGTITSVSFAAGLVSSIPGLFVDKFGTRFGMVVGGSVGAVILLLYWAVARGFLLGQYNVSNTDEPLERAPGVVVAVLSGLGYLQFIFSSFVTGSVFKIIVANSGLGSKGTAVGIAKAYLGIGAGACAMLFQTMRPPESPDLNYLLLCAAMYFFMAAMPSLFMLSSKKEEMRAVSQRGERPGFTVFGLRYITTPDHFWMLYASIFGLIVCIVGGSLWLLYMSGSKISTVKDDDDDKRNYILGSAVFCVWLGPIVGFAFLPHQRYGLCLGRKL